MDKKSLFSWFCCGQQHTVEGPAVAKWKDGDKRIEIVCPLCGKKVKR